MGITKNKKKEAYKAPELDGETKLIDIQNNTLRIDIERAKSKSAVLVVIRGSAQGAKFELNKGEAIIGRSQEVAVTLGDTNISRQHCKISKEEGGFAIEDLGSRNGTFPK